MLHSMDVVRITQPSPNAFSPTAARAAQARALFPGDVQDMGRLHLGDAVDPGQPVQEQVAQSLVGRQHGAPSPPVAMVLVEPNPRLVWTVRQHGDDFSVIMTRG